MSKPQVVIADQEHLAKSGERILLPDLAIILGRPYSSVRLAAWKRQKGYTAALRFPLHQVNGPKSRLYVLKKDVIRISAELSNL